MENKIETTAQDARGALERLYGTVSMECMETVANEIDLIIDCVDHGTTLIYSEYLDLEVVIIEDDDSRAQVNVHV